MGFDFGRPFGFAFEDKDWLSKVLIGGVLLLVPIFGGLVLGGYMKRLAARTADGADVPMPEWNRFGEDFLSGLTIAVILFVYMLPAFAVYLGAFLMVFALDPGAASGGDPSDAAAAFLMLGVLSAVPLGLIGAILALLGIVRFIDTGRLGAAFHLGEMFHLVRRNPVEILLAAIVAFIAQQIISGLGVLLLCVGVLFTTAWAAMITGQAVGQVVRIDRSRRGAAVSPTPAPVG